MGKHTPGPWKVTRLDGYYAGYYLQPAGTRARLRAIGEDASGAGSAAELEANARLIAAAPDLLSALGPFVLAKSSEELVTLVVRSSDIAAARAAIRKATGGQQ